VLTFRELAQSEFSQIPPEALDGRQLPTDNCRVVAGIDKDGRIAAVWCAIAVVHLEPLWIRPDQRRSAYILKRLWQNLRSILRTLGVQSTLTVIADSVPVTRKIAAWCGARPVEGKLYFLDIK
jgi:hypothetical protein